MLTVVFCNLWSIWKARNKFVFRHTDLNPMSLLIEANNIVSELQNLNKTQPNYIPQATHNQAYWRPPQLGVIKINTDASFNRSTMTGSSGIIGRDDNGVVVMGLTSKFPVSSPILAEALVLREVIQAAANLSIPKIILESDCLALVQACRKEIQCGEIFGILQDIEQIKQSFEICGFTWIHRSGNSAAHTLARMGQQNRLQGNWFCNLPLQLQEVVNRERLEIQRRRRRLQKSFAIHLGSPFQVFHPHQPPGSE